jgi:hypothetical protein
MNLKVFTFSAVVLFEIDEDEAASLLAEERNGLPVNNWLASHSPVAEEEADLYNTSQLKTALGKHLAQRKIESTRLLTMPA